MMYVAALRPRRPRLGHKPERMRGCRGGVRVRDETKARLEALMARYEKRLAEIRKRQELTHKRHDAFIGEFERLVDETIRPAMEDVGAVLRSRGHEYEIATTKGYTDFDGRLHNTQITMRLYPVGIDRSLFVSTSTPYVAFASDWLDTRVTVQESTAMPVGNSKAPGNRGKSGKGAAYSLGQLTPAVVEREIVDVLAGIFGREWVREHR